MSSVSKIVTVLAIAALSTLAAASMPPLRVCADANNLPFSNVREQGFENVLARMVAHDLHRDTAIPASGLTDSKSIYS